jgi:methyl-accepting chemotaxis protein
MSLGQFFFPDRDSERLSAGLRRRIPFLVWMNILLVVYFPFAAFVRGRARSEEFASFFIAIGITEFVFFASLGLVRARRYVAASYAASLGTVANILWLGILLPYEGPADLYRFAVYLLAAGTANTMIVMEKRQSRVYFGLSIAALAAYSLGIAIPHSGEARHEMITVVLTLHILVIGVNMILMLMTRLNGDLLGLAEGEAEKNRLRAEALKTLVAGTAGVLDTGRELLEAAELSRRHSLEIRRRLDELRAESDRLSVKATKADSESSHARELMISARATVAQQNLVIADAGAAIERIAGTIGALAELAESKRDTVAKVVSLAEAQGGEIREVLSGTERIRDSSSRIVGAVGGILDVSEKTQLLAMNASIEAAHAGHSGRGFAVIAGEIRKLSQETQESTRRIGEAVKASEASIGSQAEALTRFSGDMDRVISHVKSTLDALGEILSGLGGMRGATGALNESTSSMLRLARDAQDSVQGVAEGIEAGSSSASGTKDFAFALADHIDRILVDFSLVEGAIERAESVGKKSLDRMAQLDAELAGLETRIPV